MKTPYICPVCLTKYWREPEDYDPYHPPTCEFEGCVGPIIPNIDDDIQEKQAEWGERFYKWLFF